MGSGTSNLVSGDASAAAVGRDGAAGGEAVRDARGPARTGRGPRRAFHRTFVFGEYVALFYC